MKAFSRFCLVVSQVCVAILVLIGVVGIGVLFYGIAKGTFNPAIFLGNVLNPQFLLYCAVVFYIIGNSIRTNTIAITTGAEKEDNISRAINAAKKDPTSFMNAVVVGDVERINNMLNRGVRADMPGGYGVSPIDVAKAIGNHEVVSILETSLVPTAG